MCDKHICFKTVVRDVYRRKPNVSRHIPGNMLLRGQIREMRKSKNTSNVFTLSVY
jgi:hypothetical protein